MSHSSAPAPVEAFAYYLPQFYPMDLNDRWWGEGYTEWNAVLKAHAGSRAPSWSKRSPGELGFYDLRLRDTRERQGQLARTANLSAFSIYHYYSRGTRPMSAVVDRILEDGAPDFPFFFCWANHDWTLGWRGDPDTVIFQQRYDEHRSDEHFNWLLVAMSDDRYYRIDGCPVIAIYDPAGLPEGGQFLKRWRRLARGAGHNGLVILGVNQGFESARPEGLGLDAWIQSPGSAIRNLSPLERLRATNLSVPAIRRLFKYGDYEIDQKWFGQIAKKQRDASVGPMVPTVFAGWNNVGRRPRRAWYLRPDIQGYRSQLTVAVADAPELGTTTRTRLVCINAWNEWGEMMALEPDVELGRSLLEVTREALAGELTSQDGTWAQHH